MKPVHNSINYIEFPLVDVDQTKSFYGQLFGWTFEDCGPDYLSFSGAGIEGGFNREDTVKARNPGVLIVLYSADLEETARTVAAFPAKIIKPIYTFPGGRRFHFQDPNGNELAVWSEK